ncbi:MAG: transglutaminase domain-containing protein, partial [Planctomycetes bacterium]|nr:transglutaminase domain-containing protein [Planctomycetota bacterium]
MHTLHYVSLALVLASACKTAEFVPDASRKSRSFELLYAATLDEVPAGAKEVRMWLPLATTTTDQLVDDVRITCEWPYEIHELGGGTGKVLCVTSPGKPIRVETRAAVTRYETTGGGNASREELAEALGADALIPLDGKVASIAAGMELSSDTRKAAMALYRHTLERMRYDKPEGQPWGRGDAEWACDARFGNCTDFHSYFMGLARTKGIPARFEMGFSVPTGAEQVLPIKGYHCWAFFWQDGAG